MKLVSFFLIFTIFTFADDDIVKIKDMAAYLSSSKPSFDTTLIQKIKNPFLLNKSSQNAKDTNGTNPSFEQKIEPQLLAIFQNRVKINEKWYKLGDFIDNKKLIKINKKSVILKGDGELEIFLKGTNGVVIKAN